METKSTFYTSKGVPLNETSYYGDRIKTYKDGFLVSDIPLDQYPDQLLITVIKDNREGFNALWRVIDLIQANRAKKTEVYKMVIKYSAISVLVSAVINTFICLSIIAKLQP